MEGGCECNRLVASIMNALFATAWILVRLQTLPTRAGVIQSSNWPHARAIWACRAAFLGRRILLLVDLRSGLGDAAFYEISLNLELLLRAQVHHGVEGQVAW